MRSSGVLACACACVGVSGVGCGSSDLGELTFYDLPSLVFDCCHQYDSSDVGVLDSRFTLAGAPVALDQPGLGCYPRGSSVDGTEFLQCARLYARQPGAPWEPITTPVEANGDFFEFLGQAADLTRYFLNRKQPETLLCAYPPGETTYTCTPVTSAFLQPFGQLVATDPAGSHFVTAGVLGPPMVASPVQFDTRYNVDRAGNYYVQTATGWDRISPDNEQRDVDWFRRPSTNLYYKMQGIGADGRLYARTFATPFLVPPPANSIAPATLMALSHGDSEWTPVSEAFKNDLFWEDAQAIPARDGSWWMDAVIRAGDRGSAQTWLMHWQPDPKAALIQRAFSMIRPGVVAVTTSAGFPTNNPISLVAAGANAGCSLAGLPFLALAGAHFAVIACDETATLGKHTFALRAESGATESFTVTITGADTVETARAHVNPLLFVNSDLLWLDSQGQVHVRHENGTDALIAGLPATAVSIVEGRWAIGGVNTSAQVLTSDGSVYQLQYLPSENASATRVVGIPPARDLIGGGYMLAADGRIYPTVDNAQPLAGLEQIVSARGSSAIAASRPNYWLDALDSAGAVYHFFDPGDGRPTELKRDPASALDLVEIGASPLSVGLGVDGRLRIDHLPFGDHPLTSFDSNLGPYAEGTLHHIAVVTVGGEAWVALRMVVSETGAVYYETSPILLPPGRTAVAATMPSYYGGLYVWLDDGTVGVAGFAGLSSSSFFQPSNWKRLDLPGVVMPPPLPAR